VKNFKTLMKRTSKDEGTFLSESRVHFAFSIESLLSDWFTLVWTLTTELSGFP